MAATSPIRLTLTSGLPKRPNVGASTGDPIIASYPAPRCIKFPANPLVAQSAIWGGVSIEAVENKGKWAFAPKAVVVSKAASDLVVRPLQLGGRFDLGSSFGTD